MYLLNRQYLNKIVSSQTQYILPGVAFFSFIVYLFYFEVVLQFDMFRSDVLKYWNLSLNLDFLFNTWWVPGYPLLIALSRSLTLNHFSPVTVMVGISLVSFLVSVHVVYNEATENKNSDPFFLTLLFIFFPFVGFNYAVFPMADMTSISFFLLAVHSAKKERLRRYILYSALALMTHKIMWFFIPPVTIWGMLKFKRAHIHIFGIYMPLLIWIVAGAFYHNDPIWFMRWSIHFLFAVKKTAFFFDGIVTPLTSGSLVKIIKGIILLSITALTVFFFYCSVKRKLWISTGISLSLFVVALTVNFFEAWVIARYSKLLIIPLISLCTNIPQFKRKRIVLMLILLFSLLTNVIFGFYMARIFYR